MRKCLGHGHLQFSIEAEFVGVEYGMRVMLHADIPYFVMMHFQIVPRRHGVCSLIFTRSLILKTCHCAIQRIDVSPLEL